METPVKTGIKDADGTDILVGHFLKVAGLSGLYEVKVKYGGFFLVKDRQNMGFDVNGAPEIPLDNDMILFIKR